MRRNHLTAVVLAILLFGSGIAVGALGRRYYDVRVVNANSPNSFRQRYLTEMQTRLKLKPEQVRQLEGIMADTRAQFRALREASRPQMTEIKRQHTAKVKAILTPEQVPIYDQLVAEHEQHAREDEQQRDR
jgi:Spy/CpxP family protein refolding chaperone